MTGYEEQWINDHTDPDEKRPRFFNPDHPWDDDDMPPPYEDEDDFYYEEDFDGEASD